MMYFTKYENNTTDKIICDNLEDNVEKKRKLSDHQNVLIKNDSDEIDDTYVTSEKIAFCMHCVRNIIQKTIQ